MDEAWFWRLIEEAKAESGDDTEEQVTLLVKKLVQLPPSDIVEFDTILDRMMARSYTNDLWAAAYILNGGCSDDGFDYFRGWLIAQGEQVFNNALRDPESLADLDLPDNNELECENMLGVTMTAHEERTGNELPRGSNLIMRELTGEEWNEDELDDKYPRLAAKSSFWS